MSCEIMDYTFWKHSSTFGAHHSPARRSSVAARSLIRYWVVAATRLLYSCKCTYTYMNTIRMYLVLKSDTDVVVAQKNLSFPVTLYVIQVCHT